MAMLILMFAIAAAPQGLPQNSDSNKTYQVTGTVVNSVTGRPIPRALVNLYKTRGAVLTGPQGEFSFDDVPPGPAEIVVRKPGYFSPEPQGQVYPPLGASLTYRVEVGPDMLKPVLKLAPGAVISGTILGNDEEPLEGADINVPTVRTIDGQRQVAAAHRGAVSDEDGNFRIAGLAPGHYYVSVKAARVSASVLGTQSEHGNETYPALIYYPSSNDLPHAAQLNLAAGQHQEVKFALKMVPSFKVAGVIAGAGDRKVINWPGLMDESEESLMTVSRFDRESGAFEFRAVPAGSYWLQVGAADGEGHFSRSYHRIVVHSDQTDLRIPLDPGIDIPVIVQTDFSKPIVRGSCRFTSPGGEVHESDCSDYPAVRVELRSLEFASIVAYSDSGPLKGPLSVRRVNPGKYTVKAMPMFGGYVQSLRFGSVDLLSEPLVVPEGGSTDAIEVVMRDDSATLKIQVHGEKPGQQISVLVFPDPITNTEPRFHAMTQGGEVYAGQLAPGSYRIFAFDAGEEFDYSSIEAVNKYSGQATSVKVGASETASVAANLIHTAD